jgi:uncharacterized RDD family membrane protein YckC
VSAAKKANAGHGLRGRLPRRREIAVYVVLGVLWLSGVAWLVARYGLRDVDELPHPLEPWTMRVHGLAAFAALWLLGQLWLVHIVPSWHAHRRNSGILLAAIMAVLLATGWLLYSATGEATRAIASLAHWTLGLALVVPLLLHSLRHRSHRRRD